MNYNALAIGILNMLTSILRMSILYILYKGRTI
jgi:hypothetical protein